VPFAFLVVLALGQADGGAGVLTKAPALVRQVEARFPPALADAGASGTVVMELDLGADGKVLDVRVTTSAGAEFDLAALEAVRQFEFTPAEVDGVPAAVRLSYSYEFLFRPAPVAEVPDAGLEAVFSGRIVERGTREPLGGAIVSVGGLEVVTGDDGRFELRGVPEGQQQVTVSAVDHARYVEREDFVPGTRTEVTYHVRREVYGGGETVVRGKKERKEVAQISLRQEEIRLIPGTQGDAFKVIQNLPGVARAPFGIGLLVVRGSKPWDTRTYVDETFIPLLFHFGGLFATYNANLLQDLSFSPGSFGVPYGRSIGGLVEATARTPSQKGVHGYADVNVVDASALVEMPLSQSWSAAVSVRRSYIDILLPAVLGAFVKAKEALSFTVAPRYADWQVRAEWKPPDARKRFFVSYFGSSDALKVLLPNPALDPEGRGEFGTFIAYQRAVVGLDWPLADGVSYRMRTSVGLDQVRFSAGSDLFADATTVPVQMRHVVTRELPDEHLALSLGLDVLALPGKVSLQSPPVFKLDQIPDPFLSRQLIREDAAQSAVEPGLFLDAVWKPVPALKVVSGVRFDGDTTMGKAWVDPRLAVFWNVFEPTTLKAAAGLYHQPPDYRQGQLLQKFGNPNLKPEGARQLMVGAEQRFTEAISLDVQFYYKSLFDQSRQTLALDSGDVSTSATDLNYTSTGFGRSFGMEVLLRHQLTKNFFGWVAYSLSRTERDYFQGKQYGPSPLDQPHNLVALASYKLPFDFILGAKIRYTSGALSTPYVGALYDANGNYHFPLFGTPNSRRLPDFFQLDVRLDKRFVFKDWMLALYLDVQNVTNRRNVEAVSYNYDYTQQQYVTGLPILPVLGVRGEW